MEIKGIYIDQNFMQDMEYAADDVPVAWFHSHLDDFDRNEMVDHWHPEFLFGLVLAGRVEYRVAPSTTGSRQQIPLGAGDGIFINTKVLHGCRALEPHTELFTFGLSPGFFASAVFGRTYQNAVLPVICSGISSLFFYRAKEEDRTILGLLRALYDLERGPDYELSCVELLCGLMRGLLPRVRSQAGPSEGSAAGAVSDARFLRIQKMIAFIERHYARPLTVDEIARAGEVSRRECFRDFRALVGQTPTEFLNQRRLSAAAYLLVSTSRPVSEISECCGFESESYFGRLFRRRYGLPPKHFAARRLLPQRSAP